MIYPATPNNERQRLEALQQYQILDSLPEHDFDELTKIATALCNTPISLITLIDSHRQWFKSANGLGVTETPRELAFCAHAINTPHQPFIITDATKDERFHDNPLVTGEPNVIFYAGIPLNTPDGYPLGTICVIDHKPKRLTEEQLEALKALANQVVGQLELRKKNQQLEVYNREFSIMNRNLSEFSYRVSHDLKTPLRGIIHLSQWLLDEYQSKLDTEGEKYLNLIHNRSLQMNNLIDGILEYSKATSMRVNQKETVNLTELLEEVVDHCNLPPHFKVEYPEDAPEVEAFRVGLYQIFQNLMANSLKYSDKPEGEISIRYFAEPTGFRLTFTDNGPGIAEPYREKVFQLFETLDKQSFLNSGSVGVGLATVKSLTERMGGTVIIQDREDQKSGVCFNLTFPNS